METGWFDQCRFSILFEDFNDKFLFLVQVFHPEGGRWKREGRLDLVLSGDILVADLCGLWWFLLIVVYICIKVRW